MRQKGIVLVTGGAGFIGSNLVRALNERGYSDILVVDELEDNGLKLANCQDCAVLDSVEKDAFAGMLAHGRPQQSVAVAYHQAACTDTSIEDEEFMIESNFGFSKRLLDWVTDRRTLMVYASRKGKETVHATP